MGATISFPGQVDADDDDDNKTRAKVVTFQNPDGSSADGSVTGRATLTRSNKGIRIKVRTTKLDAGHAYTNWWVVFNNPKECAGGCGFDDFGTPAVEASVFHATGRVAAGNRSATFRSFLPVGLVRSDPRRHLFGPGLQEPKKAEVHYIIRSHGPASMDSGELVEQLATIDGLCAVNGCFDQQVIVFPLN